MYNNNPIERHEYEQLVRFLQNIQEYDEKRATRAVNDFNRVLNLLRRIIQEAINEDAAFVDKVRSPRLIKWAFACVASLDQEYLLAGREHLLAKGI